MFAYRMSAYNRIMIFNEIFHQNNLKIRMGGKSQHEDFLNRFLNTELRLQLNYHICYKEIRLCTPMVSDKNREARGRFISIKLHFIHP